MVGWIKMKLGMVVGLGPGLIVLDGAPAPPPKKEAQPPIFGPCLLWPNGWMDQDATWYEGRPRPRPHCVRWPAPLLSSKKRGTAAPPPIFSPCLCGQTAAWIKIQLSIVVGLGPGHIVLDGNPAPHFSAHVCCGQTTGWIKMPLGREVDLGPDDIVLDGDSAPPNGAQQLPSFRPRSIVAK